MRRRLLVSTALIAFAAVIILGVPLGIVWSHRVRGDAAGKLEREADGVAGAIDDRLEAHRPLEIAKLNRLVRPGHAVTIITRAGTRVALGAPQSGSTISVRSAAAREARVTATEPASEVTDPVHEAWAFVAALSAGGVLAALGLALLQARRLGRPLERLAGAARELGTGDFSARAGHSAIPEIDAVGTALDASAARIADLLGRERDFSSNVSHQLRTPLTALRLRLEEIETLQETDLGVQEAQAALAVTDRLEHTISDLLAVARGRADDRRPIELTELIRAHVRTWEAIYARAGRALTLQTSGPLEALGSRGAVGQALDVLLDNALLHGEGAVVVSVARDGPRAVLSVRDEGRVIAPDNQADLFGEGASRASRRRIGLHLARALIESTGGRLRLAGTEPTTFRIDLISAEPSSEPSPAFAKSLPGS